MVSSMIGSIPNTRFYLSSFDGKKWFIASAVKPLALAMGI